MTFTSLEQRMAQTYIDMLPKFIPDKNAGIDIAEQEKFYLLMNLYIVFSIEIILTLQIYMRPYLAGRHSVNLKTG
jgi:hypothetical protein